MSVRRYAPTTLDRLALDWESDGPDVVEAVLAEDESEEGEYAALMAGAHRSATLVAGLPDGRRRRVVVVVETAADHQPVTWRDVVAVHLDAGDDADPDDDLAWFATQEIGDLLASL